MKTKTFNQSFNDIDRLTREDIKPLGAKLGKLMEEVGELAECVNIHQGYITHKVMKEPLVGEVADVVQCALAVLVDAHPELSKKELMELFLSHFERKNKKWADVQAGDADRVAAQVLAKRDETTTPVTFSFENEVPASSPHEIERRVIHIIAENLGLSKDEVKLDDPLVEEYGADSLDLVELIMAIEDEFEMEIADRDAEGIDTTRQAIAYVKRRYGIVETDLMPPTEEDMSAFEFSSQAVEDESQRAKATMHPQETKSQYFDPAADYTERTGRHLSLEERMNERALFGNNKG